MIANIFGRIFAKQQKLTAQAKVSRINREIARITKNIGRAERQASQQKRAAINYFKQQYSIFGQSSIAAGLAKSEKFSSLFKDGAMDYNVAQEKKALYDEYNKMVQTQTMMAQNALQQQLDAIEEQYEQFQEIQLQAMKDEQADLEAEKATAEAQVQLYEGMEQQEKQFADSNIKNMFS